MLRDYYYILGIKPSSTEKEIKTAYRKLSMKFHPDKNNGEEFFAERFKEINEAYEILSNPEKRANYDYKFNKINSESFNTNESRKPNDDFYKGTYSDPKSNHGNRKSADNKNETTNVPKSTENNPDDRKNLSETVLIFFIIISIIVLSLYFLVPKKSPEYSPILSDYNPVSKIETKEIDSSNVTVENEFDPNKLILLIGEERVTLSNFPDSSYYSIFSKKNNRKFSLTDLNLDNKPELLTEYYTGGAHCCTVYNIFVHENGNEYRSIFEFEGGYNSVEFSNDEIKIYIDFDYFYSCFACHLDDDDGYNSFRPYFTLVYKSDKVFLNKSNNYLNIDITKNLEYLKYRGVPDLDSNQFDDGTRKAYAELFTSYYFNNNRDLENVILLFQYYYTGNDSDEILQSIVEKIQLLDNFIKRNVGRDNEQ